MSSCDDGILPAPDRRHNYLEGNDPTWFYAFTIYRCKMIASAPVKRQQYGATGCELWQLEPTAVPSEDQLAAHCRASGNRSRFKVRNMNRSLTVIASSVINMNERHSWHQKTLDDSAARDDLHNKRPAILISALDVFASHDY